MRRVWAVVLVVLISFVFVPSASAAVTGCDEGPDFNGDGFADLAIGIPDDNTPEEASGAVEVIYGTSAGLDPSDSQYWHQNSSGITESSENGDHFGEALAAGDFDGDGRDDLAVGVPREDVNGAIFGGAVHVIYGSSSGLTASGDQVFNRDTSGITGEAESSDEFGKALAACDFDADGRDDLAVGVPGQDVNGNERSGAIHVIYGSADGLTASGDQLIHQDTSGIADATSGDEDFGADLAAGDFDGDGRADIAVGIPFQNISGADDGAVHVIYGSSTGLTASGDQFLHQGTTGIEGDPSGAENFGQAVDAGDFDADGNDDLAIGIPRDRLSDANQPGAVHVIYGTTTTGLTTAGDEIFNQNASGIGHDAEDDELFGQAVASGDFDGDGFDDIGIGVPRQDVGPAEDAGAVHIVYGSAAGITASGDQVISQDTTGIADAAESEPSFCCGAISADHFGALLSSGDFDDDGRGDLVVGIPQEDIAATSEDTDEGAVHVIYGSSTGLSASGDQFLHKSTPGIEDDPVAGDQFGGGLVGTQIFTFLPLT